jgi:hypothetical protein
VFEMVATPLNAPFALAEHLPPNLMTLKLQYLPDTMPPDKVPPDEWQVCQPAHLAPSHPATHQPSHRHTCTLSYMLGLIAQYVTCMPRSTRRLKCAHAACACNTLITSIACL